MEVINFFKKDWKKVILAIGFILIFSTGFSTGFFYSQNKINEKEIIIESPDESCMDLFLEKSNSLDYKIKSKQDKSENAILQNQTGMYVASKNSKLYHKADCQYVKQIKDENRIWFNSTIEAERAGYKIHSGE